MLFESYLGGDCPICLCETRCGICESCGHPNKSDTLLNVSADEGTGSHENIEFRETKKLILPVEPYREQLEDWFASKRGVWRPHIMELADQLMSRPLADIDITFKKNWGLAVELDGWEGHVYNVWAEMGLGLIAQANRLNPLNDQTKYAQFLGYDNSYFFLVMHPVLHFALSGIDYKTTLLADYIYTNEFLNLDGKKFSTSQNHLIWGRDLLDNMTSDQARFYLSLKAPELSESNFVLSDALAELESFLLKPLRQISDDIEKFPSDAFEHHTVQDVPDHLQYLETRAQYYCHPDTFSAAKLARICSEVVLYIARHSKDGAYTDSKGQWLTISSISYWLRLVAPIMPNATSKQPDMISTDATLVKNQMISTLMDLTRHAG